LVFQDFLSKWPMVYALPDQRTHRIVKILVEEIIPIFGVPEALLSDRGTNLLSQLMRDVCTMLGIQKLNTTAYHPQCNGLVERYNRTLKAMLRKHVARFGNQWDQFLYGVQWAYRNTPHNTTGEKPSFLLFGVDLRAPSEAALAPLSRVSSVSTEDYRENLTLSLSSARELAACSIQAEQQKSKTRYDESHHVSTKQYQVGDWVLVRFPHEETGAQRKLSRPWHGPCRVVECKTPDITVVKVYKPQDGQIHVHQTRVTLCPKQFPAGYYWYGHNSRSTDCIPEWVNLMLNGEPNVDNSSKSGELLQSESERGHEETEETALSTDGMEMESGENLLERHPEPNNDDVGVSVYDKEDLTNHQDGTPYSLRPRIQPPARFK